MTKEKRARDDLMTTQEAAEALGVDIPTINAYVKQQELKAIVFPHVVNGFRIRRESVDQLRARLRQQ